MERPLLTPVIRAKSVERCQMLVYDLKSAPAGRAIIFSDEKTRTIDPVRNRRNDRYLSLGEEDESARTFSKTKHPAPVISLSFVASNGAVMSLVWFPSGYRLTARDYETKLPDKLVSWITFNMSCHLSLLWFNRMVPQHTPHSQSSAGFPAGAKFFLLDEKHVAGFSPDANSLGYAFWPHIEVRACNVHHSNITALRVFRQPGMNGHKPGLRYQKLQGFQTPF